MSTKTFVIISSFRKVFFSLEVEKFFLSQSHLRYTIIIPVTRMIATKSARHLNGNFCTLHLQASDCRNDSCKINNINPIENREKNNFNAIFFFFFFDTKNR
ncbi:hypothetical protein NH340_JMT00123 [Sarcoptes scabiei]|nr:hypothetical protein NH340_JMT00123 [Sarcoptes scabiei]